MTTQIAGTTPAHYWHTWVENATKKVNKRWALTAQMTILKRLICELLFESFSILFRSTKNIATLPTAKLHLATAVQSFLLTLQFSTL